MIKKINMGMKKNPFTKSLTKKIRMKKITRRRRRKYKVRKS